MSNFFGITCNFRYINAEPEPAPVKDLPTSQQSEIIIGYRGWLIAKRYQLKSVYRENIWTPLQPMTGVIDLDNPSHSGVYAYKSLKLFYVAEEVQDLFYNATFVYVYGEVSLWGKVLCTNLGYRAEFAYPRKLFAHDATIAQALRRTYGVEVETK